VTATCKSPDQRVRTNLTRVGAQQRSRSGEIDLTTKNAASLRTVLRPYIDAGRTVNGAPRRPTRIKVAADTRTVKEWARANGYQVRDRGRVPNEVLAAFEAAN
jgi:hypothetical protein